MLFLMNWVYNFLASTGLEQNLMEISEGKAQESSSCCWFSTLQMPHCSVVQHTAPATTKALKSEVKICIFRNEGEKCYSHYLSEGSLVVEDLLVLDGIVTWTFLCVVEIWHPCLSARRHCQHQLICLPEKLVLKSYVTLSCWVLIIL